MPHSPQLSIHLITQLPQLPFRKPHRIKLAQGFSIRIFIIEFPQRPRYNPTSIRICDFDPLSVRVAFAGLQLEGGTSIDGFGFRRGTGAEDREHELPECLGGMHPGGPFGCEKFGPVCGEVDF